MTAKVEAGIIERDVTKLETSIPENPPEVVAALSRAEKKKLYVQVLERGVVDDRLKVDLPDHLHGQWCRNNGFSISRLQQLGYWVDLEYAPKQALHSDGTGRAQIADVIHMICNREDHEILEEIRKEQFIAAHGTPDTIAGKTAKEVKEYGVDLQNQTDGIIPMLNQSSARAVRASEISDTLRKLDAQGG